MSIQVQDIFLSQTNIEYLIGVISGYHPSVKTILRSNVLSSLKKFCRRPEIEDVLTTYYELSDSRLRTDIQYLNDTFARECNNELTYVTIPKVVSVDGKLKDRTSLQVDDYKLMSFGSTDDIHIPMSKNRYSNRIPVWRKSIHRRNYDTSSETLDKNISYGNIDRGFNMSRIKKQFGGFDKDKWFGY